MLGRLIPLLPILFLLGGFFTGHIALLPAVIVLLYIIWVTYKAEAKQAHADKRTQLILSKW
ncbi:hypothetical protein ACKUFK_26110, partial [Escherichia coli]|uniref:hypothetical protein n=1 Tax=Escherichia coli TaxID=562 RepID=UPI00390C9BE3